EQLENKISAWGLTNVSAYPEEPFFVASFGLTKNDLSHQIDLSKSLYSAGWYYQQILKLGAGEGICSLSENYLVWDSDLFIVDPWPIIREESQHCAAFLQHRSFGNPDIVGRWERWIREILKVEPATDKEATYIPHHLWFNQTIIREMLVRLNDYYQSDDAWPLLMMKSGAEFGTFSEFWLYSSWLETHHHGFVHFYPYQEYGATTERFFDDGNGKFSRQMREYLGVAPEVLFEPTLDEMMLFIQDCYSSNLPSSLSFEASSRHIKKADATRHLEETRSRWR
ncbi:MAG: DUF6492 family protein, partial [Verrucomicrobiota bacterium]